MDRVLSRLPTRGVGIPIRTAISYIFDYAIIVILAIAYAALDKLVTPFNQRFSLTDITIQYPFATQERIPIFEAILISCAFPAVVIALYTLIIDGIFSHRKVSGRNTYTFKDRMWELNCGILGLLLSQGAAFCITGTLKNLIGRPRPDLISRCLPREGSIDGKPFGLSSSEICTQTSKAIMQDGFRSFPSGHASASFAGLFYLSLYLSGKLHILDQRGEVWRTFIVIVPPVAASCIAASRIMDYRHHAFDVLFGSALGILCAWASYRQYFPSLSQSWRKGRAYPMREWGVAMKNPDDPYNGYRDGRVDRTAAVIHDVDDESSTHYGMSTSHPERTHPSQIGLEPMRARNIPSPQFQHHPGHVSHAPHSQSSAGFENISMTGSMMGEDSEYERVRPQYPRPHQHTNSDPRVVSPAQGVQNQGNAFREQIANIQVQRGGHERSRDDQSMEYKSPTVTTSNRM